MKLTRTTFAAALALYLAAVGLATPPRSIERAVALDMAGVRAVTLRSPGFVTLRLGSRFPPALHYTPAEGETVDVRRDGDTLLITSTMDNYNQLRIDLPATVAALDLERASVDSESPLEEMQLRASGTVSWSGDVRHLDLVGTERGMDCPRSLPCARRLSVESGRIERLTASIPNGVIALGASDTIGEAQLRLGPQAKLSLGAATRLEHLRVVPLDGAE